VREADAGYLLSSWQNTCALLKSCVVGRFAPPAAAGIGRRLGCRGRVIGKLVDHRVEKDIHDRSDG